MRARIMLGCGLLVAAGALAGCVEDPTSAPPTIVPNFNGSGGGPVPDCRDYFWKPVCQVFGRMTGGGGQDAEVDGIEVYITRGFTIHCDLILSNNLEINWPGNKWHIDKPLTAATCIDDPTISPVPPRAPFDTFIGEGIGRLNGEDGSLIRFTFVDDGERGGDPHDFAGIQIFAPDGTLVLDVPVGTRLKNGNIQAHFDQPHNGNGN